MGLLIRTPERPGQSPPSCMSKMINLFHLGYVASVRLRLSETGSHKTPPSETTGVRQVRLILKRATFVHRREAYDSIVYIILSFPTNRSGIPELCSSVQSFDCSRASLPCWVTVAPAGNVRAAAERSSHRGADPARVPANSSYQRVWPWTIRTTSMSWTPAIFAYRSSIRTAI